MLTVNENNKLVKLLMYEWIRSRGSTDILNCKLLTYYIDTENTNFIRIAHRRILYFKKKNFNKILAQQKLQISSKSQPFRWSVSMWSYAKKVGTTRICVDFRRHNDVTTKFAYLLLRIDDIIDALHSAKYFSTLELAITINKLLSKLID